MRRSKPFLIAATLIVPSALAAQQPPTRPNAATIVSEITSLGYLGGWGDYVDFAGCPQEDPVGAEVLDLLSRDRQTPSLRSSLVQFWADEFATCGYAPLHRWVIGAVASLADEESWHLSIALSGLDGAIDATTAGELLALASDPSRPAWVRTAIGDATLRELSPTDRSAAFLGLLATTGLPADWVAGWSANLLQALGPDFLSALVSAAGSIDDDTLRPAMGVIMGAVLTGSYPSDPSFLALVRTFEARPGLSAVADFILNSLVGMAYQQVLAHIQALTDEGLLDAEDRAGLETVLTEAWTAFQSDRPNAPSRFDAFVNYVEGLVSAGELSAGDAQPLVDAANGAISALTL